MSSKINKLIQLINSVFVRYNGVTAVKPFHKTLLEYMIIRENLMHNKTYICIVRP